MRRIREKAVSSVTGHQKKKKKTEQQQYFLLSVETVAKIVKFPNSHSSTKLSVLHC